MVYGTALAVMILVIFYVIYRAKKIKSANEKADFKAAAEFAEAHENTKPEFDDEAVKMEVALEPKILEPKKNSDTKKKVKKISILEPATEVLPKKKVTKKKRSKKIE
jgi:hypothetical protein